MALLNLGPRHFYYVCKSNTLGYNKVYFICATGNDNGYRGSHRTPEFSSISSGPKRDFSYPPYIYNRLVTKCGAGSVVYCEADHSNDSGTTTATS
jgi:hypothetical protein